MLSCPWCGRNFSRGSGITGVDFCSEKCRSESKNAENSKKINSSGGSGSSGCFIATSVYGNYDHPIVLDLREFRDNWLEKRENGKKFIRWYYQKGPMLASWIDKSKTRKLFALSLIVKPLHLFVKLFRLNK